MSPLPAAALPGATPAQSRGADRAKLSAAARQFEAIFVRQMLAAARKAAFGGAAALGSKGLETFRTMQDEKFADLAAETGAFGLAKMIELQLSAQVFGAAKPVSPPQDGR